VLIDKNMRILVVDDFKSMRDLIRNVLKKAGFTNIVDAEDGEEAWKIIEKEWIELVISDWNMPNMPGIDLLKKVRASESYKDLPFLMVTAEGLKDNVVVAIQAGVSGYIVKPFSPSTVEQKIQKIFDKINK
jgi:two-component system, chemotaxis family, chemotaxis protein CheY